MKNRGNKNLKVAVMKTTLEKDGKVSLPKEFLMELDLKEGDEVTVETYHLTDGTPYIFVFSSRHEKLRVFFNKLFGRKIYPLKKRNRF